MDLDYLATTTGLAWKITAGSPTDAHCTYGLGAERGTGKDVMFSTTAASTPTHSSSPTTEIQEAIGCAPDSVESLTVALHAFSCTELRRQDWVHVYYPGGERYLLVSGLVPEGDLRATLLASWEPQLPYLIAV